MSRDHTDYWIKKLGKYETASWSGGPSLFAKQAIKFFPEKGRILELGAGVGQDGKWFSTKNYQVLSTDLTDKNKELGETTNFKTQKNDLSEPLNFEKSSFDVVYAHLSLHYFSAERTRELFDEIYEILKPDGILAFIVNSTKDPEITDGEEIEKNFREIDGIEKRFFDLEFTKKLTKRYKIFICSDRGTSYKDKEKGIFQLIQFVGQKR